MMTEKGKKTAYTLEFKLEALRPVQDGQAKAATARILGVMDTNESVFAAFFVRDGTPANRATQLHCRLTHQVFSQASKPILGASRALAQRAREMALGSSRLLGVPGYVEVGLCAPGNGLERGFGVSSNYASR